MPKEEAKEKKSSKEGSEEKKYLDPKTRPYGAGKYESVIKDAMKFLEKHGPGMVKISSPGDPLPPEGREEAKKKKGQPAKAEEPEDDEPMESKASGVGHTPGDPGRNVSQELSPQFYQEDYVLPKDKIGEAPPISKEQLREPPPDFMPDSQKRLDIWGSFDEDQKRVIIEESMAANVKEPGYDRRYLSPPREIEGGGRQADPQRTKKDSPYRSASMDSTTGGTPPIKSGDDK